MIMTIQSQAEPTALYYTYLHHEKLQKKETRLFYPDLTSFTTMFGY